MLQHYQTTKKVAVLFASLPLILNACAWLPEDGVRAKLLDMPNIEQTVKLEPEAEKIVADWPKAQWWQDFHSPQLNQLIETALRNSPTLRAAIARLSQAEAAADYQAAEMLPSIGGIVDIHRRRFSETDFYGPTGGKTMTAAYLDVAFRYHLDLWGKDQAALEATLGKEKAQASELAAARLVLSSAIAKTYFRLGAAEVETGLAHAMTQQQQEKLHLAQLRWQHGLTEQDPIHLGSQKLEAAQQREASLQVEAQILRNRLAALAGQGPDWGKKIQVSTSVFAKHFPMPEKLGLRLLTHRPDVAAALWQVEAAAKLVKVAKTNFYPDVNLVGFAGLRSLNIADLFLSHGASLAYSLGPTITLPIFEGGRLEAELKGEQAGYNSAVEIYNSTLLAAVQQVADALAIWRESHAHDSAQERAIHAAEMSIKLAEKRFQAGMSTRDGIIEANYTVLEQRLKASQLQATHLQAAVALFAALGGGYETAAMATSQVNSHE